MDQFGLLPPHIRANYEREEVVDRELGRAQAVDKALRAYDERLSLVWVNEGAPPDRGMIPGRWHVHRRNLPPAPDSYMPVTGPDGEYREPHHGILNELAKQDTWKHGTPTPTPRKTAAEEKAEALEKPSDHLDEMVSDFRAARRVPGEDVFKKRWGRGG